MTSERQDSSVLHKAAAAAADIAVIIVNWNAGALLARCLDHLSRQTLPPRRAYVVDNASSDGSCDRITADFPEVTLIRIDYSR